jgi:AcrR family transcriptional regulator
MRQRIVEAAVTLIEQGGEHTVRLRAVADIVGIAYPSCYHYFPNRESLIIAAHCHRLRLNLNGTIGVFLDAVKTCTSKEQFVEIMMGVYNYSFLPERTHVRKVRAELVGAAIQREDLRQEVVKELLHSMDAPTEACLLAQERGWLSSSIDARTFAIFNMSLISSLVYAELIDDDSIIENWKHIATQAVKALITHEDN